MDAFVRASNVLSNWNPPGIKFYCAISFVRTGARIPLRARFSFFRTASAWQACLWIMYDSYKIPQRVSQFLFFSPFPFLDLAIPADEESRHFPYWTSYIRKSFLEWANRWYSNFLGTQRNCAFSISGIPPWKLTLTIHPKRRDCFIKKVGWNYFAIIS